MASPPHPQQQPTPGSSFYPQNHELVTQYLLPKLAGSALPAATQHFFVDADVYADDPETLTSRHQSGPARTFGESENWYFFVPEKPKIARDGRKPRVVGGGKGTWEGERGEMVVDPVEGRPVGHLERFTYTPRPKEKGKKPEWLMVEFSLDQEVDGGGGEPRIVLCKIYRSPRLLNSASKASSSASACKSNASARKRKAADLDFSPASLSASGQRKTLKTTDDSSAVRRQLLFPYPPAPNPMTDEAFLGKNCDSVTQQRRSPSPPAPIPLGDVPFLGDEQFWSEYYCIGELPDLAPNRYPPAPNSPVKGAFLGENSDPVRQQLQFRSPPAPNLTAHVDEQMVQWDQRNCIDELPAPWLCSMMAAPVPFCGGMDFCNSIAAP